MTMTSVCEPLSAPPLGDPKAPRYRDGRKACRFIEANCRHGEGDKFGQPVRLDPFQKGIVLRLLELRDDGTRRYRRAFVEMGKGNGKSPICAWIGAFELVNRPSAVVPVAAASYEQADLVFGDLRDCVRESPSLSGVLDAYETEVQVKDGPGRAFRIAAIAGTNDGLRPTLVLADELHEWEGNRERVFLVLGNGAAKRENSLQLAVSTPGWDLGSLAGQLHEYGLAVNRGEIDDPEFCFIWFGAQEGAYDLDDPAGLRAAIRAANPAADSFLRVEDVAARFHQIPRHEFCRYHLAQWTTTANAWLPAGAWNACADPSQAIPDGARVVLAFDGSATGDSTAVVAATVGPRPHVVVLGLWERGEHDGDEWRVPRLDVLEVLRRACRRFQVVELACDPYLWRSDMETLSEEGIPVVEFPQNGSRMIPATQRAHEMVLGHQLTHSGDPNLARHIANAVIKTDSRGSRLVKESKRSTRRIDLAIAAVMALDRCQTAVTSSPPGVWSIREVLAQMQRREASPGADTAPPREEAEVPLPMGAELQTPGQVMLPPERRVTWHRM
jgi:phage terminase large subunit-like protein